MKRIKMILIAMMAVAAVGVVGAGSASASQVDMTLSGTVAGVSITPCQATLTTTGGPPPASTTLVGSSFVGTPGSANPCDPTSLQITNNPVASFSGSGPYTATINQIRVKDLTTTGCTFVASATSLSSLGTVLGPYNGTDTAPGSGFLCSILTANITVANAVFS